ncbi:MAG: DUF924 family protein [Deltaproteobacteria bacterium]|nr:DUF924 family protein [Deltaproteobacteria bacterium]
MTDHHDDTPRSPTDVVTFWRDAGPERWFNKDETFDATFRDTFLRTHEIAAAGALEGWLDDHEGALALLVLLDQFPRNAFRGTARMYATDPLARRYADRAIELGHDERVDPAMRFFFYLPFAHSESLEDQDRSVALHERIHETQHANGHRDIIRRFGRFPHRNALLGRETTAEEKAFLDEGGFGG